MAKYQVAVTRNTLYEVEADSQDEAIDFVLEGKGEEVDEATMDVKVYGIVRTNA